VYTAEREGKYADLGKQGGKGRDPDLRKKRRRTTNGSFVEGKKGERTVKTKK